MAYHGYGIASRGSVRRLGIARFWVVTHGRCEDGYGPVQPGRGKALHSEVGHGTAAAGHDPAGHWLGYRMRIYASRLQRL